MAQDDPQQVLVMGDFPGLVLDTDPHDAPPGSSDNQVNVTCEKRGALVSREGFLVVSFES